MKLIEYLGGFSVEDLRELARRRGIPLRQEALRDRQTLLRNLSGSLATYEAVHSALNGLNQAELGVLQLLLTPGRPSAASLTETLKADLAEVRTVLEQLRLWGLAFPEGNWDHIGIPASTQLISSYLTTVRGTPPPPALKPPPLEAAQESGLQARTGSFGWDLAEFLARVSRSRLKLTQKGAMNRRDLRSMESAFSVPTGGYSMFVYLLATSLGILSASREGILQIPEAVDDCLGYPEPDRSRQVLHTWVNLRGYPESSGLDPADADYIPSQTFRQRIGVVETLRDITGTVSVACLAQRLQWLLPRSFEQWEGNRSPTTVTMRIVRSLHWMGLVRVDDPEAPKRTALTPLGERLIRPGSEAGLIPEEPLFFLQPNAETFSPPNLSPRTLYHLRRVTGEKKGGPAGVYPVTQESLRRALDSGLASTEIVRFLERFSRTGLPDNVRTMIESVGRQHGRIRLVPAQYVLVTEDPNLLQEIRSLKPIAPLLGRPLTERSITLGAEDVTEVLRRLRARGYAPLDELSTGEVSSLPEDPQVAREPEQAPAAPAVELDWSRIDSDGAELEPAALEGVGELITDRREIRLLLERAEAECLVVEIDYQSRSAPSPITRCIWPLWVDGYEVEAYCCLRAEERHFSMSRIRQARLTGETFEPSLH